MEEKRYKTVEEMCADSEKAVYHFFPAYLKEKILQEGLLVSMNLRWKAGEKKGIYVVWSDDERIQTYIAQNQAGVNGEICRVKMNLKKYEITAKDIAPDLNGDEDCDPNSYCCKIVKDIKHIHPEDIEVWDKKNGDLFGVEYYNLDGYNIEHKPVNYEDGVVMGYFTRRTWKQMDI